MNPLSGIVRSRSFTATTALPNSLRSATSSTWAIYPPPFIPPTLMWSRYFWANKKNNNTGNR